MKDIFKRLLILLTYVVIWPIAISFLLLSPIFWIAAILKWLLKGGDTTSLAFWPLIDLPDSVENIIDKIKEFLKLNH